MQQKYKYLNVEIYLHKIFHRNFENFNCTRTSLYIENIYVFNDSESYIVKFYGMHL